MARLVPPSWSIAAMVLCAVVIGAGAKAAPPAIDHTAEIEEMAAMLGFPLDYDDPPKPDKIRKPTYPKDAFDRCVEGTVVVLIGIDANGGVVAAKVVESKEGLDEAALACVKGWHFKPARKNGEAVGHVALAPISFKIYDKAKRGSVCEGTTSAARQ